MENRSQFRSAYNRDSVSTYSSPPPPTPPPPPPNPPNYKKKDNALILSEIKRPWKSRRHFVAVGKCRDHFKK